MNEIIKDNKKIEDMIQVIRGVQVILDSDLAVFTIVLMVLRRLIKRLIDIVIDFQVILCFK